MTIKIKRRGYGTMTCRGCQEELDVKSNWRRKNVTFLSSGKPSWNCKCDACFKQAEKAKAKKVKLEKAKRLAQPAPENMTCKNCNETKNIKDNWKRSIKKRCQNGKPFSDIVCDSCHLKRRRRSAEISLVLNALRYVRTINQDGWKLRSTHDGHRLAYLSSLKSHEKYGHKFNIKKAGWAYYWFPATSFHSSADLFEEYSSNYNVARKLGVEIPSNIPKPKDAFETFSKLAAAINSDRVSVVKNNNKHSLSDISDMISRSQEPI